MNLYSIIFTVDLSSHSVTDEIHLGCHSITLGEMIYIQISAAIIKKTILFNIDKSVHDTGTKVTSMPMFSRSIIRINTIKVLASIFIPNIQISHTGITYYVWCFLYLKK